MRVQCRWNNGPNGPHRQMRPIWTVFPFPMRHLPYSRCRWNTKFAYRDGRGRRRSKSAKILRTSYMVIFAANVPACCLCITLRSSSTLFLSHPQLVDVSRIGGDRRRRWDSVVHKRERGRALKVSVGAALRALKRNGWSKDFLGREDKGN